MWNNWTVRLAVNALYEDIPQNVKLYCRNSFTVWKNYLTVYKERQRLFFWFNGLGDSVYCAAVVRCIHKISPNKKKILSLI